MLIHTHTAPPRPRSCAAEIGEVDKNRENGRKRRASFRCARPASSVDRPDDLAGVHDVVGIERVLDRAHQRHRLAVLRRRGTRSCRMPTPCSPVQVPPIAQRARDHALVERLGASAAPSGSSGSTSMMRWKLPSPTWPTIGAQQARCADVLLRLERCIRRGARSARRRRSATRPQPGRSAGRVVRVVARLPQPRALLGLRRPLRSRRRRARRRSPAPSRPAPRRRPRCRGTRRTASASSGRLELRVLVHRVDRCRRPAARCARPGCRAGWSRSPCRPRPRASSKAQTAADIASGMP